MDIEKNNPTIFYSKVIYRFYGIIIYRILRASTSFAIVSVVFRQ